MAPTHNPNNNYSNFYSTTSTAWENQWSYPSTSSTGSSDMSSDMSAYWSSYDPDHWPTFQPAYHQPQEVATNAYYNPADFNMAVPPPIMGVQQNQPQVQSFPDFIAMIKQQQLQQHQQQQQQQQAVGLVQVEKAAEGVVDAEQLKQELNFLESRKKLEEDEKRKAVEAKQKEETKKKAEAMRKEEEQWVTSATYQLPIFSPVDLGEQPWLSDNYRKSRLFFKITKFDSIAFYENK